MVKKKLEKKLTLEQFREWGKQGGKKTSALGKEHYSKAGKKGMDSRWGKK